MDQEEARKKVAQLVEKYNKLTPGEIKNYSEEETKKGFIEPLFKALGWDITNKEEVSAEEHVKSSGLADYGFYINGRAKFYLEAKAFKADLYKEEFARQAIRYSFNKVVTWAVLTDFQNLKVFNANAISNHLGDKQFLDISYTDYLERFDELWLLSREAFEQDLIDVAATRAGKMLQKVSVTDKLYEDLNKCRELLTRSLSQWNPKVPQDLLDEGVQKLLDRLIFIRVAEDRNVEPPTLKVLIREWHNHAKNKDVDLYQSMVEKFRELDAIYDSNLFGKHPFEKWEEYSEATEKVINILYGKEGYYDYDFKYIPADVLGNIYENYLGYQLLKSEKGLTTSKDAKKRKEQGIYYTPTYIVDYIVTNALKPVLDKCETVAELKQIKVLDPACGSGSFLLKAMEVIADKYKEFGYKDDELTKIQILTENIYGVDLDEKAVEIAQLNLLINSLDTRMKLPNLAKNIKNGNSLISGTDQELEKAFGKDYRDKKPFNWQEEFPEVFNRKNPGFDVVIGNPPYVGSLELSSSGLQNDKEYFKKNFESATGNFDLYVLFIEQSLELLRSSGQFSFIVPNKFLVNDYGINIRKIILSHKITKLTNFSHLPVFQGTAVYPVVLVIDKSETKENTDITSLGVVNENLEVNYQQHLQSDWLKTQDNVISLDSSSNTNPILQKLESASVQLSTIATVSSGTTGFDYQDYGKLISDTKKPKSIKFVITRNIHPYIVSWGNKINYLKSSFNSPYFELDEEIVTPGRRTLYEDANKILIRGMAKNLIAGLDQEGFALGVGTYAITDSKLDKWLLLALLNSKALDFYYRTKFKSKHLAGGYLGFNAGQIKQIPIYDFDKANDKQLIDQLKKLSSTIYKLSLDLGREIENSNKWHSIQSEIEKTDQQINQLVYKLYDLTPEEVSLIEGDINA